MLHISLSKVYAAIAFVLLVVFFLSVNSTSHAGVEEGIGKECTEYAHIPSIAERCENLFTIEKMLDEREALRLGVQANYVEAQLALDSIGSIIAEHESLPVPRNNQESQDRHIALTNKVADLNARINSLVAQGHEKKKQAIALDAKVDELYRRNDELKLIFRSKPI